MICPNCQTFNQSENVFCVNCGTTVSQAADLPPTQFFQSPKATTDQAPLKSEETAVLPVNQFDPSMANFTPSVPHSAIRQPSKNKKLFLLIGAAAGLFLLIGIIVFFVLVKNPTGTETLPEHLGMFIQSPGKDKITEIRKQDFASAVEGADKLLNNDGLTIAEENPNLILYSDGKDVPLNDLRLIRLDTIKPDGNLKQLDFQAAPVENKTEMKRIRIPGGIAVGKYAFAILDGHLDDGKHKFWAFEVKNSAKSNSDADMKSTTVSIKPQQNTKSSETSTNPTNTATQPSAPIAPPPGATIRYVSTTDVIFRSGPSQSASARGKLSAGQKVYVLGYSSNYEYFQSKKTGQSFNSNYAEVQTENGRRGWVYAAFLR